MSMKLSAARISVSGGDSTFALAGFGAFSWSDIRSRGAGFCARIILSAPRQPSLHAPADRFSTTQRHDFILARHEFRWQRPGFATQRHALRRARQTVEVGAVETREAFEPVQRASLVEGFRIELQRVQRRVTTRTAARVLLQPLRMRRAVRAER